MIVYHYLSMDVYFSWFAYVSQGKNHPWLAWKVSPRYIICHYIGSSNRLIVFHGIFPTEFRKPSWFPFKSIFRVVIMRCLLLSFGLVIIKEPKIGQLSLNPDWRTPVDEKSYGEDVINKSIRDWEEMVDLVGSRMSCVNLYTSRNSLRAFVCYVH